MSSSACGRQVFIGLFNRSSLHLNRSISRLCFGPLLRHVATAQFNLKRLRPEASIHGCPGQCQCSGLGSLQVSRSTWALVSQQRDNATAMRTSILPTPPLLQASFFPAPSPHHNASPRGALTGISADSDESQLRQPYTLNKPQNLS